ncbi:hypothetical protein [Streptomyces clavifer]
MRRANTGLAAAASLLAGAVGCGEGERGHAKEAWEKSVPPERLCGGALSAEAGKGLKAITESTRFEASNEKYTVAAAAEEVMGIVSALIPEPSGNKGDLCRIYTPVGTTGYELPSPGVCPVMPGGRTAIFPQGSPGWITGKGQPHTTRPSSSSPAAARS